MTCGEEKLKLDTVEYAEMVRALKEAKKAKEN
jgi:hypothetical protein